MKLPSFSLFKKQEKKEYFLSLLLHDETIKAVVFEETAGEIHIVNSKEEILSVSLEQVTPNVLLTTADKAIGGAETALPENIETHKTIFGLKGNWVEQTAITKEKLEVLKHLCKELSLEPLGFLVFSEAIAHLLQKQEGAPVSGILVELEKTIMTVTLLRAGRVIEAKQTFLSENLPHDVDTVLREFTQAEILPSRIIIFDSRSRPNLSQSFIHHHWTKTIPFLHVPQIMLLNSSFDIQAVLYGTATQMGFTAADLSKPVTQSLPSSEKEQEEEYKENRQTNLQHAPKEAEENRQGLYVDNFGFVNGKDVLAEKPAKIIQANEESEAIFSEISNEEEAIGSKETLPEEGEAIQMGARIVEKKLRGTKFSPFLILQNVRALKFFVPHLPSGGNKLFFLIPFFLLILVGGILWYIFGVSAQVTILVTPNVVSAEQTVTFAMDKNTDTSSNVVGDNAVTVTESGSTTTNATGSKDIGDKAKGTVTIYNLSDSPVSYSNGTTITADTGQTFTLNNAVTVASGSSDPTNPVPGKQNVVVTASDIGTTYNVPSGMKFSISNNSSVAAKNDNAFSGGTKQTVTVVSQDDIATLTKNLTSQLSANAKADLQKQANGSQQVLPVFLKTELTKKDIDNQVGTQAKTVTLTGTVSYTGIAYQKADLDMLAKTTLQDKMQKNVSGTNYSEDIGGTTVTNNDLQAKVTFKASLMPNLDTQNIAKQIAGKPIASAKTILTSIPEFTDMTVALSPHIPLLPAILPRLASHIHITVNNE
ncbi:MAG TPA: hypothetical protein VGT05_02415 [Patescibacteria group bacterium]|nr:hypothetical protein [Patescibacteria group bacterium]